MMEAKLSLELGAWRKFVLRRLDRRFKPIAKQVFERDDHTCQYCGFQAYKYQEVVNRDNDYTNYAKENLVTACCFCSQCFFLEEVGRNGESGGQLIYLPEMQQSELNAFCHVLFCAMGNGTEYQDSAQSLYRSFRFRAQLVERRFGEGTSNPAVMGRVLLEYQLSNPEVDFDEVLSGVRLLPLQTKFRKQLDAWANAAVEELAEEEQLVSEEYDEEEAESSESLATTAEDSEKAEEPPPSE
jgi:intracellular multiplication protein IcmJ